MKIALILNGNSFNFESHINKDYFIVAVDCGANHCQQLKIRPHLIIGDLDSISADAQEYFSDVPQIKISDQETTDLEKALYYLKNNFFNKKNIESVDIFCASSLKRADHFLANLFFISRLTKWPVKIIDEYFVIYLIGQDTTLPGFQGKTVSMFPVEHCTGLTISGFKWPLNHKKYSISNIITENPAQIKIAKGKIILIINK